LRGYPKAEAPIEGKMLQMREIKMDNPQVTDWQIAWLAGIWDGEGTISVRRNKKINQFSPRVSMVNTSPDIINYVDQLLTQLDIPHYIREKGEGGFDGSSKQCWIISMDTLSSASRFLETVGPYLVGKYERAKLLEKFVNSRVNRRDKVTRNSDCTYNQEELDTCKKLYLANGNQRGTSETIRETVKII
jgi:hypothetical protein